MRVVLSKKYTSPTVHEYQACLELDRGRFDVLWGCDEMLLSAWVAGARGAVGSTYNVAAPLFYKASGYREVSRSPDRLPSGVVRDVITMEKRLAR